MTYADALSIAANVRSGKVSAREVAVNTLERISAANPELNAFLNICSEAALDAAKIVDDKVARGEDPGLLAGVPIALKDNLCTRGIPTTCASKILDGWKPPYDASVVKYIQAAGGLIVGKTNLDEFAMGSSTENSAFKPAKNPRDVAKVPGGSSGGSAAAVAGGLVPLALGSDTGGSIRQPASLCGVVGVKPTYGYVSRYGLIAFSSSLDQIGPFANSVADAALMMDVIGRPDQFDSTCFPTTRPTLSDVLDQGVQGLRVGIFAELIDGCSNDVVQRVNEAAEALEAAGAKVGHASVPAAKAALSAYYLVAPAECSSNLARFDGVRYGLRVEDEGDDVLAMYGKSRAAGFGAEVKRRIMLGTYALSAGYYDAFYAKAQKVRTLLARDFERAYQQYDVLISPVAPTTAFNIGEKSEDPLAMYLSDMCTIPTNLAGHPAISVPFGLGDDGMPIGVQVLAAALGEVDMFRAAAALEQVSPRNLAPGERANGEFAYGATAARSNTIGNVAGGVTK